MPKKMKFEVILNNDELFDKEVTEAMRGKISQLMRSEFDKQVAQKCQQTIDNRLKTDFIETQLKVAVQKVVKDYIDKAWYQNEKDNPIVLIVNDAVSRQFTSSIEKMIVQEVERRVKVKFDRMKEALKGSF